MVLTVFYRLFVDICTTYIQRSPTSNRFLYENKLRSVSNSINMAKNNNYQRATTFFQTTLISRSSLHLSPHLIQENFVNKTMILIRNSIFTGNPISHVYTHFKIERSSFRFGASIVPKYNSHQKVNMNRISTSYVLLSL